MSCKGCSKKEKAFTDKRGNTLDSKTLNKNPKEPVKNTATEGGKEIGAMEYADYLTQRELHKKYALRHGQEAVDLFSDDYKRIQITELVLVYNHEEVLQSPHLSPTQALVALWEMSEQDAYKRIFEEFDGLVEQVKEKVDKLKKEKILLKWKK